MAAPLSFHKMKAAALRSAKKADSPAQAAQGDQLRSAEAIAVVPSKKRDRVKKGPVVISDAESEQNAKKAKVAKDRRAKSPVLDFGAITLEDLKRFQGDPLEGATVICRAASELICKLKRGDGEAVVELTKERDLLRAQLQAAKDELKSACEWATVLETSKTKDEVALAKADEKLRKADLHIQKLEGDISKLNDEIKDWKLAARDAELAKEGALAQAERYANEGFQVTQAQFNNALD